MIKILFLLAVIFPYLAYARDINFYWTASPTPGVTGYKIYIQYDRINYNDADFVYTVGNVTNYTATGLPDEVLYAYITAISATDESLASNEIVIPGRLAGKGRKSR